MLGQARRSSAREFEAPLLAGLAGVLLASAAAVPAAFAGDAPDTGPGRICRGSLYRTVPVSPVPATTVHVINTGGMPGWQITLIAIGPRCSPPPSRCSWTGLGRAPEDDHGGRLNHAR